MRETEPSDHLHLTDEEAGLKLGACWVLSLLGHLGYPYSPEF